MPSLTLFYTVLAAVTVTSFLLPAKALSKEFETTFKCGESVLAGIEIEAPEKGFLFANPPPKNSLKCEIFDSKKVLNLKSHFGIYNLMFVPIEAFKKEFPPTLKKPTPISSFPVAIGAQIYALPSSGRDLDSIKNALFDSCDAVLRGQNELSKLPTEEKNTHPDQVQALKVGFTLCNLNLPQLEQNKKNNSRKKTLGKIVYSDDINFIAEFSERIPNKTHYLFSERSNELVGFTNYISLNDSRNFASSLLRTGQSIHKNSIKFLKVAIKSGLWDY